MKRFSPIHRTLQYEDDEIDDEELERLARQKAEEKLAKLRAEKV